MNIPTPDEFTKQGGFNPFPPRWERWLSSVRASILSSQPQAGRHVSVDEHPGKGTVINVDDTSARRPGPPTPATGACCRGTDCTIETQASCESDGGVYQGDGTPCDPNPCSTGACCTDGICTDGVTRDDCEGGGGLYLGNGSTCEPVDCTCCPILARFNTITFSGQVIGCDGGIIDLPEVSWTRASSGPGCSLSVGQFATDSNCGCQFQAKNCFPFVEVDQLFIDNTGGCPYGGCLLSAEFFCDDGTVLLSGAADVTCCVGGANAEDLSPHGPYDITSGSLDVTYASDTNPAISFRYIITLS